MVYIHLIILVYLIALQKTQTCLQTQLLICVPIVMLHAKLVLEVQPFNAKLAKVVGSFIKPIPLV